MIKISPEALEETNKLSKRAINNNQTDWQSDDSKFVRIVALNTRSLNKHFSDILYDFTLLKSDFLCLSETWIENHNDIKNIEGFSCYTSGSGRGKGVAVYSCKKHNLLHSDAIENIEYQILHLEFVSINITVVYIWSCQSYNDTCPFL